MRNRLKELRKEKGVTQAEVAKIINTNQSQYGKYENGKTNLSLETSKILANYFDVSVPYLLGLEPEVPNSKILTPFQLLVKESQKKLTTISEETGIAYSTLSGYNQGTRTPKKKNAKILADYFGVSVPYLLGLDDNPPALNDSLEKIMVIHEVLKAGDNILVAQELLKNSLETLVKYAENDYRVQFKHHLLIANTLSEVIGKLDIVTENDEFSFKPDKLNLSNN